MKLLWTLLIILIIIGCHEPINLNTREKYESDHKWCVSYGVDPKTNHRGQYYSESYKECMERMGYKF